MVVGWRDVFQGEFTLISVSDVVVVGFFSQQKVPDSNTTTPGPLVMLRCEVLQLQP